MKKLILALMAILIIACNQNFIQEFEQRISDYDELDEFLLNKGFSKSVTLLDSGYRATYESPQADIIYQLWDKRTYVTIYYVDTVNVAFEHLFYIDGKNVTDSLEQYKH